jgi:hypothetical protein
LIATLGIDDAAGNQGSALCTVIVDEKVVFSSPPLRGGRPPVQIPALDLAQAKQLKIVIEFGEEGDVLDLVDLCDAVLVKASGTGTP